MNRGAFLKAAAAAIAAPYIARFERAGDALAALAPAPSPVGTTIDVVGSVGRTVHVGDVVRISTTGETLRITALPEDLGGGRWRWRADRGIGSIAPQPVSRGDELHVIGSQTTPITSTRSSEWDEDRLEPRVGWCDG